MALLWQKGSRARVSKHLNLSTIACFSMTRCLRCFPGPLCVKTLQLQLFKYIECIVHDRLITSNMMRREVLSSYNKFVNKSLLLKCLIVSTCELYVWIQLVIFRSLTVSLACLTPIILYFCSEIWDILFLVCVL